MFLNVNARKGNCVFFSNEFAVGKKHKIHNEHKIFILSFYCVDSLCIFLKFKIFVVIKDYCAFEI